MPKTTLSSLVIFITICSITFGQKAPAAITSVIIVKILPFEKNINSSGELNLYVMGAPDVAAELKKVVGKKVGEITIKSVDTGDKLPTSKPSAIFNDDPNLAEIVSKYTKSNKIVSLTRNKDISKDGISILIELTEDGKPLIFLNPSASKAQDLEWNPAIFKIAKKLE